MGANETSPLEELRPYLYVGESSDPAGLRRPPVMALEPFTAAQARTVYERYQASAAAPARAAEGSAIPYALPACRTLWEELPQPTRELVLNPLYLHLFMEAFGGGAAEPRTTVPARFRRYVDRAVDARPGLREGIAVVIDYLLQDLGRAGADLTDDDVNAILRPWEERRSPERVRLEMSPVEGLVHEGMMSKRVSEEGGGFRFVFQAVAEYLIYRQLANGQPAGEEEPAYWSRRAESARVFPEYAGALAFLLRDWMAAIRLGLAGRLVEAGPAWLRDVVTAFLVEQARVGHVAGSASPASRGAARALQATGTERTADILHQAGYQLGSTRFGPTATVYFHACVQLREALWQANPDNVALGADLGRALTNLGNLLRAAGRVTEAAAAYRRAVELGDVLWRSNPENVDVKAGYAGSLCAVRRLVKAKPLVDEVLAMVPYNPYANAPKRFLDAQVG